MKSYLLSASGSPEASTGKAPRNRLLQVSVLTVTLQVTTVESDFCNKEVSLHAVSEHLGNGLAVVDYLSHV